MKEEYKKLKDFPNYRIYKDGKVWSEYSKKFLSPSCNKKGYLKITLYSPTARKHFQIHRLVAMLFLDNPNNLPDVNHKNENKKDNNVSNLEWCDKIYNNDYGTRNQRIALSNSKTVKCIELNKIYISATEAGRQLNIDPSSIRKVCKGQRKTAGGYHWEILE